MHYVKYLLVLQRALKNTVKEMTHVGPVGAAIGLSLVLCNINNWQKMDTVTGREDVCLFVFKSLVIQLLYIFSDFFLRFKESYYLLILAAAHDFVRVLLRI